MVKHDVEFKKMIVRFYESGTSVSDLSNDYDLKKQTIYIWIRKYKIIKESITGEDIIKMQKEIAKIKEENDVLKKFITIFSIKNN